MLYLVHGILRWGWPAFVTEDWDRVLTVVSLSIVATIIANTLFFWYDRPWFKSLMNLMTTAIGLIAAIRMWQVFPFDFTGYAARLEPAGSCADRRGRVRCGRRLPRRIGQAVHRNVQRPRRLTKAGGHARLVDLQPEVPVDRIGGDDALRNER